MGFSPREVCSGARPKRIANHLATAGAYGLLLPPPGLLARRYLPKRSSVAGLDPTALHRSRNNPRETIVQQDSRVREVLGGA